MPARRALTSEEPMTTSARNRVSVGGWIASRARRRPGPSALEGGPSRAQQRRLDDTRDLDEPTTDQLDQADVHGPTPHDKPSRPGRPPFWRELGIIVLFYGVYTALRDLQGIGKAARRVAVHHALELVSLERALGIFHERAVQRAFLDDRLLIRAMDDYYDLAHFLITIAVLVLLWARWPGEYRRARNALALTTAIALAVFAFFPEAPPRLLPARFGFVDTLHTVGGFFSLQSPQIAKLSDPYAAMPSLHFAWALWCALAAGSVLRRRWLKALLFVYPALTFWVVIVTANHFFLDVVAGGVVVALSWWATAPRRHWGNHWHRLVTDETQHGVSRQSVGTRDRAL
jgi:hypothetical protein